MNALRPISTAIKKGENFTGIFIILMMIVLMLLQVFFRYILRSALAWSEELNRLAMVWLGFIGACIAVREREHIKIEVLYQYVSERVKKIFRVIGYCIVVPFSLFMLVYGVILISKLFSNRVGAMDLPVAIFFIPLPLSGLLFLYHMIFEKSQKEHTTVSLD